MIRVGTVIVASRKDLNHVLVVDCVKRRIDKGAIRVVLVSLLEQEVFVLDVIDGRQFWTTMVVVQNLIGLRIDLLEVRTKAVVDDLDTRLHESYRSQP